MEQTNTITIMDQQTLRQDMADTGFKFFDRIEGYILPGYEINKRKVSTKTDTMESITVGYDAASSNPFKNLGEFIQSSGKMGLETFKVIRNPNTNRLTVSFEFLNQDKSSYTFNEAIIFFVYSIGDRSVSFMSPKLKLLGGVTGQTRITLSKYSVRYVHDSLDESSDFLNTIVRDFSELSIDAPSIPIVFEMYIK